MKQGVVFYLSPQTRFYPQKNQNGTMAKDALFVEKLLELRGPAACASSPGCNRALIGQHDLVAANA